MATNVLVVGGGAREHALVWSLAASSQIGRLYCAPGNAGTALLAESLPFESHEALAEEVAARDIDLIVVGPEAPLAAGLGDLLRERGHLVFGPSQAGARIESSKAWAKEIMEAAGVPTGLATTCTTLDAALEAVAGMPLPMVVKADGLAAGKGVVICHSREEAEQVVREMMEQRSLGAAADAVLIEEFMTGPEVSLLCLTDGDAVVPLLPACDYKQLLDGDEGPNTGGMGAYAPPAIVDEAMRTELVETCIRPVVAEMTRRGIPYRGVLYAGLMLTPDGPKVLEFNCRFGDPETQVLLPMLNDDLVEICLAVADGRLSELGPLTWFPGACVGVVLASDGYPGAYTSGHVINGLDQLPEGGVVFHAATAGRGSEIVTTGGRVLTCVGRGEHLAAARELAYATADALHFDGAQRRSDIAAQER